MVDSSNRKVPSVLGTNQDNVRPIEKSTKFCNIQ